jgi:5-deoxy-glucuronate isomerase
MNDTITKDSLVFRGTNKQLGRHISITPDNSAMRHLHYGRIRLVTGRTPEVTFDTEDREVGLICLSGLAYVTVDEQTYELNRYDGLYVPPGKSLSVVAANEDDEEADLAEFGAPVTGTYPVQHVRYQEDVLPNPSLHFKAGEPGCQRTLNIVIGKNVEGGRILAGVTQSQPGNWTSWPPHEHGAMLEELYVYYDMPAPAFGVQFVYADADRPDEHAIVVRDGDAVLMPGGYHPNVSVPGHQIKFLWIMAAHREGEDRQFGVVNVQPGFGAGGSGLEASRK